MKKFITKKLTFFAFLSSLIGFAHSGLETNAATNKKKETDITFSNVEKGTTLTLKGPKDTMLYSEVIDSSGQYTKSFDFTLVPEGDYYFELDKDLEITIIPLKVSTDEVEIHDADETKFYKPIVTVKDGNKVLISQLSLNQKPLKIEVYYEGSYGKELIFQETLKNQQVLDRIYQLKQEDNNSGHFKVVLSSEGRVFTKDISL
ncbi:hypothetical protein [Mangrovimonas aestuarii]|uniref:hypothetical protein n=1 Tax=Mangrovimonas aestuarii TaxID=3018443 RepID=UPI002379744F|nr:hypothetical protein [Mangrovimonas aestuarii]